MLAEELSSGIAAEKSSIVVAMSGGVDSSVAALLLAKLGHKVIGVSMQVWDYRKNQGAESRATCCSPADFCDARMVAAHVGIPFYVADFEDTFRKEVIDRFVRTYQAGLTPNPCIDCNSRVKFRELRQRAAIYGCDYIATGHYARIKKSEKGYHLLRGLDPDKDQSYFLYTCLQEELAKTLFPIGDLSKPEVRELAKAAGLPTAEKAESQDICFVADSVHGFVSRIGGKKRPGKIVSSSGEKVGDHDGITNFTVGQRRGLKLGGNSEPMYVVGIDAANDSVIVGSKKDLEKESFQVNELNWVAPITRNVGDEFEGIVQVRSRHKGHPARIKILEKDLVRISWLKESAVVSPGQAAVIYDTNNLELLGGGRIIPFSHN